jgi:hypothetical protein
LTLAVGRGFAGVTTGAVFTVTASFVEEFNSFSLAILPSNASILAFSSSALEKSFSEMALFNYVEKEKSV